MIPFIRMTAILCTLFLQNDTIYTYGCNFVYAFFTEWYHLYAQLQFYVHLFYRIISFIHVAAILCTCFLQNDTIYMHSCNFMHAYSTEWYHLYIWLQFYVCFFYRMIPFIRMAAILCTLFLQNDTIYMYGWYFMCRFAALPSCNDPWSSSASE